MFRLTLLFEILSGKSRILTSKFKDNHAFIKWEQYRIGASSAVYLASTIKMSQLNHVENMIWGVTVFQVKLVTIGSSQPLFHF